MNKPDEIENSSCVKRRALVNSINKISIQNKKIINNLGISKINNAVTPVVDSDLSAIKLYTDDARKISRELSSMIEPLKEYKDIKTIVWSTNILNEFTQH